MNYPRQITTPQEGMNFDFELPEYQESEYWLLDSLIGMKAKHDRTISYAANKRKISSCEELD